MKKILLTMIIASAVATAQAQPSGPASQKKILEETVKNSTVKEYDISGIKVIHKPAPNQVISAKLFIKGGVDNYTLTNQGIEELMLQVLTDGGSTRYPKEQFHALGERKGISIDGSANYDYSVISLRTVKPNWDMAWDMFSDLLKNPSWNQASFDQQQQQQLVGLQQELADPDETLRDMSMKGTFAGKRYEKRPSGRQETVQSIQFNNIQQHFKKLMEKNRLLLVVVGDVTEEDLKKKVAAAFGNLPVGKPISFTSNPVSITQNQITTQPREIATNYIRGIFSAAPEGTRESLAMKMAMAMLAERLFVEVRTKRNLSYAPGAFAAPLFDPYSVLYVSTTDPSAAVQVMTDEMRKIKKDGFGEKEFASKKEGFLTEYYLGQETNSSQASSLGVAELKGGWETAEAFNELIKSLTLEEVNQAFRKYASAINWFYLGNVEQVDEKLFINELK